MPSTRRPRLTEKVSYWLDFCRRYIVKQADLGGDGQDIPFEQAFANLAHAYLKDKAPGLLDYEVGFQLLQRNEDNSKAVGVFGFKVGSQWLYAPVFFLNGDLKGHELLYLKGQDAFVPLKENWINYLLNRQPLSLGKGIHKDTRRLGVRAPDLQRIVHSPASSKVAAALPAWLREGMPGLAYALVHDPYKDPLYAGMASLPEVIKAAGDRGVRYMRALVETYPTLVAPLERFYGRELVDSVEHVKRAEIRRAAEARSLLVPPPPAPPASPRPGRLLDGPPQKRGAVQVINYDPGRNDKLKALTDDDRQALIRDGYRVIDERRDEEVSRAFRGDIPATTNRVLTNPNESGLYDCLIKPGEFGKCAVFIGPHGPSGRSGFATVIKAEDSAQGRGWVNIHPSYVFIARQYSDEDFRAWLEEVGEPAADGLSTEEGKQFVAAGIQQGSTLPFIVEGEVGDPDGSYKVYKVRFDLYADKPRPAYGLGQTNNRWMAIQLVKNDENYDRWEDGERIHLGGRRGTKLRSSRGDVFVPSEMFIIEVEPAEYDDEQWKAPEFEPKGFKRDVANTTGGQGKSKTPPLVAMSGNVDADLGIYQKTASLEVRFDGASGYINGGPTRSRFQLLSDLVVGHNLREKVACQILDECAAGRYQMGGPIRRYRIVRPEKQAAVHDYGGAGLADQGATAPGIPDPAFGIDDTMGSGLPSLAPQMMDLPVSGMGPDPSAATKYQLMSGPDPGAVQAAQQAAQTGQREIFDTAAVGGMLKATRDDQLTDRFLGDLMKGLSRIGHILMLLYWHQDQFEDRYGKTEVPELEDSLRNAFEDVGDLVLFLKQKSIEPDPQAETQHIDLKATDS